MSCFVDIYDSPYFKKGTREMTPYDTGKVKIGIHYQPKQYIESDKDMLYLQEMLIRKAKKFSWRELIKHLFW